MADRESLITKIDSLRSRYANRESQEQQISAP